MYKSIHLNKICLWSFLVISLILFLSPVSNTISSLINDKVSHAFAYGTLFFLAAKSYKDKYSSLYIGLVVFLFPLEKKKQTCYYHHWSSVKLIGNHNNADGKIKKKLIDENR